MGQPKSPENEVIFAIVIFYLILAAVLVLIHYTGHVAAAVGSSAS